MPDYRNSIKESISSIEAIVNRIAGTNGNGVSDALERISKPELTVGFLQKEFDYVADKLDLTRAELQEIFDGENKTFHDYTNKIKFIGFGAQMMQKLGLEKRLFR